MVICQICKQQFKRITNTHLVKHGITQQDYFKLFPGEPWEERDAGLKNYCIDCKKEIGQGNIRCWDCHVKFIRPKSNYCIDCSIEISSEAKRCHRCARFNQLDKKGRKYPRYNFCIDCGISIDRTALRCRSCASKKREILRHQLKQEQPQNYCKDCGTKICLDAIRCYSCAQLKKWEDPIYRRKMLKSNAVARLRGDFDNIYKSPSRPELDIMNILDNLGVKYIVQYRIKDFIYDIYLPDSRSLIEYDGWYWHHSEDAILRGQPEKDIAKNQLARDTGLNLIRLSGLSKRDLTYDEIWLGLSNAGIK